MEVVSDFKCKIQKLVQKKELINMQDVTAARSTIIDEWNIDQPDQTVNSVIVCENK